MVRWQEMLTLARELVGATPSPRGVPVTREGRQRTAINRAYYAAFGTALNWSMLNSVPGVVEKTGHKPLWEKLKQNESREVRWVALLGANLYTDRIRADYRSRFRGIERRMNLSISRSDKIIAALADL